MVSRLKEMFDNEFNSPKQEKESSRTENISETGSEVLGAIVGGVVGLLAGPAGSVGGALTATVVTRVTKEFAHRFLSSKETYRIGKGVNFIVEKISINLQDEKSLRDDDFFESDSEGRSEADEILESVLIKCKNEPQEKKLRYVANIFANTAFRKDISASDAYYLVQISEELTYRQLCLISLVEKGKEINQQFSWGWYRQQSRKDQTDPTFNAEQRQLSGFIHAMGNTEESPFLEPLGKLCYELMSLSEIPLEDLVKVAELIKR